MTADLTPTQYRDALLDMFTEITADCERLALKPIAVHLHAYAARAPFAVRVQFSGADVTAVDALADAYGLPPDDPSTVNYTREAPVVINGQTVEVGVFTARPRVVHDPGRCILPAAHLHTCLPHPQGGQARSANDAIPAGAS